MPGVIQKITGNIRKRTLKRVPKKTGHVIFFGNHKNGVVVRVEKEPNENSFYYLSIPLKVQATSKYLFLFNKGLSLYRQTLKVLTERLLNIQL